MNRMTLNAYCFHCLALAIGEMAVFLSLTLQRLDTYPMQVYTVKCFHLANLTQVSKLKVCVLIRTPVAPQAS